ncbi:MULTISPECIES: hypothetical protein [unclassified Neorhizobium]|uniref:VirE2 family protein n=1 Tax=unclassified Neorhizobium TaxID=2629175 RepID=UPI001FF39A41|nr:MULTISPECIES: hypothetical protein [unclassified Neorhizobium]MCJ9672011.1 hypothetical protein [Neorhizobium sp. SHOUNA12B]MCJ9747947.1 hypothetical protein [Neorhizobium sp. SHOUNA12A]
MGEPEDNFKELAEADRNRTYRVIDDFEGSVFKIYVGQPAGKMYFSYPIKDFESKFGKITGDMIYNTHQITFVDRHGNAFAASQLNNNLYDQQADNAANGKPPGEARKEMTARAKNILLAYGLPDNILKPARVSQGTFLSERTQQQEQFYKLQGEKQFLDTPGGKRPFQYEYQNKITSGSRMGDCVVNHGGYLIHVYCTPGDGFSTVKAITQNFTITDNQGRQHVPRVGVVSSSNTAHDSKFFETRPKWGTPDKRLALRVEGTLSAYTPQVTVTLEKNGNMINAEYVLRGFPDSKEASLLRGGPLPKYNDHIPVHVRDQFGTMMPIEMTDPKRLGEILPQLGIYSGSWFTPTQRQWQRDGKKPIDFQNAPPELFEKYGRDDLVRVHYMGQYVPLDSELLKQHVAHLPPAQRMGIFTEEHFLVATIGKHGGRFGAQRPANAYSQDGNPLPESAYNAITSFHLGVDDIRPTHVEYDAAPRAPLPAGYDNQVALDHGGYNPAHAPYNPAHAPYDPANVPYDPAHSGAGVKPEHGDVDMTHIPQHMTSEFRVVPTPHRGQDERGRGRSDSVNSGL